MILCLFFYGYIYYCYGNNIYITFTMRQVALLCESGEGKNGNGEPGTGTERKKARPSGSERAGLVLTVYFGMRK